MAEMNLTIPKNIVFDLGGVLIDWNPRHLFSEVFKNNDELEFFLSEVCSSEWNEEQDGGRSLKEGTEQLIPLFPEYEREIRMFYSEWEKMLGGAIESNVEILRDLKTKNQYRIFALTNWSAETFPIALKHYEFLHLFEDILVSGVEKMRKPQPEIYQLMLNRFGIQPETTVFIDDNERNILAAEAFNIRGIHLPPGKNLMPELEKIGVI